MWAAITDSEKFAINIKDTDGTPADFDDFAFTGRNFIWGCYYVFSHLVISCRLSVVSDRLARLQSAPTYFKRKPSLQFIKCVKIAGILA